MEITYRKCDVKRAERKRASCGYVDEELMGLKGAVTTEILANWVGVRVKCS